MIELRFEICNFHLVFTREMIEPNLVVRLGIKKKLFWSSMYLQ